jgi:hypothetical protein
MIVHACGRRYGTRFDLQLGPRKSTLWSQPFSQPQCKVRGHIGASVVTSGSMVWTVWCFSMVRIMRLPMLSYGVIWCNMVHLWATVRGISFPVIVIVIVNANQDSTSSRLLPGSSYSCCIRNLYRALSKTSD